MAGKVSLFAVWGGERNYVDSVGTWVCRRVGFSVRFLFSSKPPLFRKRVAAGLKSLARYDLFNGMDAELFLTFTTKRRCHSGVRDHDDRICFF